MKIGVFDSGIGGKAVAARLAELLPEAEIMSVDDHAHVPYGSRSKAEIIELSGRAIQPLIDADCDVIVIACNTATTVAISALRTANPDVPFVGIEPMIKPAAELTKTKTIAVLATPGTLASERYAELKTLWGKNITILEPDCHDWATLIENNQTAAIPLEETLHKMVTQRADVIVLACTHYHYLKQRAIAAVGKKITILEPSDAIARRIKTIVSLAD